MYSTTISQLNELLISNFNLSILITVFISALIASFGHCIFMCGGFVNMMLVKNLETEKDNSFFTKLKAGILPTYHIARIISYTFIALTLYTFTDFGTKLINISAGYFIIIAGIMMVFFAITGHLRFKFITKLMNKLMAKPKHWAKQNNHNFILGIVLGFLPCGLVYSYIALSLGMGSHLQVLLIMLTFGIATTIPLVIYAIFGQSLINSLQNKIKSIKFIILSLSGLWLIYVGFAMTNMNMDMSNNTKQENHCANMSM